MFEQVKKSVLSKTGSALYGLSYRGSPMHCVDLYRFTLYVCIVEPIFALHYNIANYLSEPHAKRSIQRSVVQIPVKAT
jgi:hypothetical protein